jgi:flagellar hook-basal body complex protein FliE
MTTMPLGQAALAYTKALTQGQGAATAGVAATNAPGSGGFAQLVQSMLGDAIAQGAASEAASVAAVAGKAEVSDIVTAVANAEVALETVVAVRDKVIGAYQEIMRMPV